ncbi:hypothetical protein C1645_828641 [Glomus cerebriforme]|uniref:Protein-S-isoprenylcysteine O-methyltransferase n=1 Tax=Glomus cerebriforme TaxID=658196 RepID=A0A397SKY0_9GLOM|nr:hypothetical protein C1645_828641 [Glomus cerebriforme]
MYTKITLLIIQTYLISKAISPPTKNVDTKKVMSIEGLSGIFIARIPKLWNIFSLIQALVYIFIMFQQELGLIPIFSKRFSELSEFDIFCFSCTIGGSLLRLWCYKCLKEFFTFNVTVKKNHRLITTGPYSLLVHPSYIGGALIPVNYLLLWYQLYPYIPVYVSSDWYRTLFSSLIWFNVGIQIFFHGMVFFKRIYDEERTMKKHFGKEWDIYFSERKRFIPFIY